MTDYTDNYDPGKDFYKERYPLTGWGQIFQHFLRYDSLSQINKIIKSDSVIVDNRAKGGRSARTFFQEGRWRMVYKNLKPDDVIIR